MKVLIAGAKGFLGRHLQKEFLNNGYTNVDVTALCRKEFDLTRPDTWKNKMVDGVDCFINAAAMIDGKSDEQYSVNTFCLTNLLAWLQSRHCQHIINLSTGSVYAESIDTLTEESICKPSGTYATSKYLGELIINDLFEGRINHLRLFYPYGVDQNRPRLVPVLIDRISKGEKVFHRSDGGPRLSMSRVDSLAKIIINDFVLTITDQLVVNLVTERPIQMSEIIDRISTALNVKANVEIRETCFDAVSSIYTSEKIEPSFQLSNQEIGLIARKII